MTYNLHVLYEHDSAGNPHGCSFIRLLRPLAHPGLGNGLRLSHGTALPSHHLDAVVVERQWRPDISHSLARDLVADIRERNLRFIYTLDDNLLDLNMDRPWLTAPTPSQRMVVRYFARQADRVVVSTPNLHRRLSGLNDDVRMVANALDERLYAQPSEAVREEGCDAGVECLTIGYMGTLSHTADLMMIVEPLRAVLHRHRGRVRFEIVGVSADPRVRELFSGLPVRFLDVGRDVAYERFARWTVHHLRWDFAIAPLQDTWFNRFKSDIKFLDYGILGIPGIFSKVDAYRDTVEHGVNGWLCEAAVDAWVEALETFIAGPELRARMAAGARRNTRNHRVLEKQVGQWRAAFLPHG